MMCITLRELRQLIEVELLDEGIFDLANSMSKRYGIIDDVGEQLIVIDTKEMVDYEDYQHLPKVVGTVSAMPNARGSYRIETLYADSPRIAIMLLAAALEYWMLVIPDFSVSPAAKAVIKRYYDQNVDDPSKIEPHFDKQRSTSSEPYLSAAYKGPVGFDMKAAEEVARKSMSAAVGSSMSRNLDHAYSTISDAANMGFHKAYTDVKKTGSPLDKFLRAKDALGLVNAIDADLQYDNRYGEVKDWVEAHRDEVKKFLTPEYQKYWAYEVEERLVQMGYALESSD